MGRRHRGHRRWMTLGRPILLALRPLTFGALIALFMTIGPRGAFAAQLPPVPPEVNADAKRLLVAVDRVQAAADASDWPAARIEWKAFDDLWDDVEDGFRAVSRPAYRDIETTMSSVAESLRRDAPSLDEVRQLLATLRSQIEPFLVEAEAGTMLATPPQDEARSGGLGALMAMLDSAIAAARADDAPGARQHLERFHLEWLEVEGQVKTQSPAVYRSTEDRMGEGAALLRAPSPRTSDALVVLQQMRADLAPMADAPAHYGIFDAAIILLREGAEALLVVVALLAFLAKSRQGNKAPWIWGGAAAGVIASVLVAIVLRVAFASAAAGIGREVLEGVTGLVAAGMLLYVSHWLHSKASLAAWQGFVDQKMSSALAGGALLPLAAISFLAVFREGAETVLFYVGMAPAIDTRDLLLGIALGTGALVVMAVTLLGFGLRIPIRPFFLVSSLLLYYLAFKFIGTGVHALQVAAMIPATPLALPAVEAIGLFPTRETTIPQLVLLAATAAVYVRSRFASATRKTSAAEFA